MTVSGLGGGFVPNSSDKKVDDHPSSTVENSKKTTLGVDDKTSQVVNKVTSSLSSSSSSVVHPHTTTKVPLGSPTTKEATLTTSDISTHFFFEKRIGAEVLAMAEAVLKDSNEPTARMYSERLVAALPSYGDPAENEISVVRDILREGVGIDKAIIRELSGGSGAKIYGIFLQENPKKLAYVVKTIKERPSELAKELISLEKLSDLGLRHSSLPMAQAAGRFTMKGEMHTVFVQTAAQGSSMSSLIEEIGKAEGSHRKEKIEILREGFVEAARGLAELHAKDPGIKTPISQEVQERQMTFFAEEFGIVDKPWLRGKGLSRENLEQYSKKMSENLANEGWGFAAHTHGDTHLDNLFFAPEQRKFSFIDTPSYLSSVDKAGRPAGYTEWDVSFVLMSITEQGFSNGLTREEIEYLKEAFLKNYDSVMDDAGKPAVKAARIQGLATKHVATISRACDVLDKITGSDSEPLMAEKARRLQNLIDHEIVALKALFLYL